MERRLGLKLFCVRSELGPVVPMTSHFTLFPPRFVSWTRRGVSSESFEIQLFQLFLGFLAKTNKKKKKQEEEKEEEKFPCVPVESLFVVPSMFLDSFLSFSLTASPPHIL